jgi:hypothetical protein
MQARCSAVQAVSHASSTMTPSGGPQAAWMRSILSLAVELLVQTS